MSMDIQTRWVDVPSETGRMAVFVAEPTGPGPFPGLAYFHVLPGINEQHRSMAARIASEGFVVAMPDLYNRMGYRTEFKPPAEREQAFAARRSLTYYGLAADSRMALNLLREHDRVDPERLGVIGYCLGGTVAYLAAAFHGDVRAAAVMYGPGLVSPEITPGVPVSPLELADRIKGPMLWLSARGDEIAPPSDAEAITARMEALGKTFECHIYEDPKVGHAFFDEDIAHFYDADAAAWGWPIKLDFLRRHLQGVRQT